MQGSPSLVKGAGLRTLSRRRSWVRIPPPAPILFCDLRLILCLLFENNHFSYFLICGYPSIFPLRLNCRLSESKAYPTLDMTFKRSVTKSPWTIIQDYDHVCRSPLSYREVGVSPRNWKTLSVRRGTSRLEPTTQTIRGLTIEFSVIAYYAI